MYKISEESTEHQGQKQGTKIEISHWIRLSAIVAAGREHIIGIDDKMPWKLSSDMEHFKQVTMGKVCIMGRKTYTSIPKKFRPLPGRFTIVVTRDRSWREDNVFVAHSIDDALLFAYYMTLGLKEEEVMICGGGEIYRETMRSVDRIYLTKVDYSWEPDPSDTAKRVEIHVAHLPPADKFNEKPYSPTGRVVVPASEADSHSHQFFLWERKTKE